MVGANRARLLATRGAVVSMIFQEPMTSLNPLHKIGRQVAETLVVNAGKTPKQAAARVQELFELVGLASDVRTEAYPHELSGGQRQRVMIAMALAREPKLLVADEPTTALDVIIQKQILELLRDLQERLNMALLLISHDLTVVRSLAERICVMTKGEIVEEGSTDQIFAAPKHTYTKHLLGAEFMDLPPAAKEDGEVVAEIEDLNVNYSVGRHWFGKQKLLHAVRGMSLKVQEGQTIGIVGESGSGKTTLGMALLRLTPSEGRIVAMGRDLNTLNRKQLKPLRQNLQIVFQDPYGSLSPRMTVGSIVGRGLRIHHPEMSTEDQNKRVAESLEEVGLSADMINRYPHEFSGGQRQRISIARALVVNPKLIVMDEPTSSLDVSVQAQIVELLRDVQKRHDLVYLFISHDLKVVRALAHYLVVMRNGVVVEQGPASEIFDSPSSDYTRALMSAAFIPQIEAQSARNATLAKS
jgi:microcin C transport system ATP-binding protein